MAVINLETRQHIEPSDSIPLLLRRMALVIYSLNQLSALARETRQAMRDAGIPEESMLMMSNLRQQALLDNTRQNVSEARKSLALTFGYDLLLDDRCNVYGKELE